MYEDPDDRDFMIEGEGLPHGMARWLPSLVVLTAIGGFLTLAWYAYHAGTQSVRDEDLLVVEADDSPIKEKPLDPGGMQFPDQDKTVFETFSAKRDNPKVERVLPPPEEPIMVETAAPAPVEPPVASDKPELVIGADTGVAVKLPADEAPKPKAEDVARAKEAARPMPSLSKDVAPADNQAETFIARNEAKAETVKKEAAKTEEKLISPADAVPASGNVRIQLGAYRSEEEALAAWGKIVRKHANLLSGRERLIVRADLGAKGIYYRLRIPGFANTLEAKAMCDKLTARGQACILAPAR